MTHKKVLTRTQKKKLEICLKQMEDIDTHFKKLMSIWEAFLPTKQSKKKDTRRCSYNMSDMSGII